MRKLALIAAFAVFAPCVVSAIAQDQPKSEEAKLRKARKENHTVRQVTPDPKKSPGKHADDLSKNVNHEVDRTSKHVNKLFQGKKKKHKTTTHKS